MGIFIRIDVRLIRIVVSSKYILKINIGFVGRKNVFEDLGYFLNFFVRIVLVL